jgi:hypothetical protein
MYRTEETTQLVTKGIPNRFRRDIWMTFSGAIFDKQSNPGIRFSLLMLFIPVFRIRILGSVHLITEPDPDPALLVNDFQDANKKLVSFLFV